MTSTTSAAVLHGAREQLPDFRLALDFHDHAVPSVTQPKTLRFAVGFEFCGHLLQRDIGSFDVVFEQVT